MPGKSVVSLFCKLKSPAGVAPAGLLYYPRQKFHRAMVPSVPSNRVQSARAIFSQCRREGLTTFFVIHCKYPPTPHPYKTPNRLTLFGGAILACFCGCVKKACCAKMALLAHAERIYLEKCRIFMTLENRHAIRFRCVASVQRQGRTPSCADLVKKGIAPVSLSP